jgi:hypothetical protein
MIVSNQTSAQRVESQMQLIVMKYFGPSVGIVPPVVLYRVSFSTALV